jgi:sugar phosphate isomerase/epimerase
MNRRSFLQLSLGLAGGLGALVSTRRSLAQDHPLLRISLAEWSFNRALFSGAMDHLDFATTARRDFGIGGVEYVNQFFFDKAKDAAYLREMKTRADGENVESLLIMCDGEGRLGDPDPTKRHRAVVNHHKWADAAKTLGCHSIRVNAHSEGGFDEQMELVADGLHRLVEYGADRDLNVLVENHGGLSSNGRWLSGVMKRVDHPRCGTLPDFGNFGRYGGLDFNPDAEAYDRYLGVEELMPWALALSAKSVSFDADGEEEVIDYRRMLKIALDAGYSGWIGIEYGGKASNEAEGVRATQKLLERTLRDLHVQGEKR